MDEKQRKKIVSEVREIYIQGFMKRYGISPRIDVKFSSICVAFVKENGEISPEMMQLFIDDNNPFYIKNCHAIQYAKFDSAKFWTKVQQKNAGVKTVEPEKTNSQKVKDAVANIHHGLDKKDYRAGVDENGYLIDEPKPMVKVVEKAKSFKDVIDGMSHDFDKKDYRAGVDENGFLVD